MGDAGEVTAIHNVTEGGLLDVFTRWLPEQMCSSPSTPTSCRLIQMGVPCVRRLVRITGQQRVPARSQNRTLVNFLVCFYYK